VTVKVRVIVCRIVASATSWLTRILFYQITRVER